MWLAVFYFCKPKLGNTFFIGSYGSEEDHKKKSHETVKEELLNLHRENNEVKEPGFNVDNVTNPREAVAITDDHIELTKTENKKNDKLCC